MDVYLKNLFDNHSIRTDNNGPSTTNNKKQNIEIVIFDYNIISSNPQSRYNTKSNSDSNNRNDQMVLNIRKHRSIMKYDDNDDGDDNYDNDDKNSYNNDNIQNQNQNYDTHLCRHHILVHENPFQRFLFLMPCVLVDINNSSSSISNSINDNCCTCINNNSNNVINRNTNTTKSRNKLTSRMKEHRLSRWDSSSSLVPTTTQSSRSPKIRDIPPITYSRIMSPAIAKSATTISGIFEFNCINSPISHFPIILLKPPQRQSSDLDLFLLSIASTSHNLECYSPLSKAA